MGGKWSGFKMSSKGETKKTDSFKRKSNRSYFGSFKKSKSANGQPVVLAIEAKENDDLIVENSFTNGKSIQNPQRSGPSNTDPKITVIKPSATVDKPNKKKRRAPLPPKKKLSQNGSRKTPENSQGLHESAEIIPTNKITDSCVKYSKEIAHKKEETEKGESCQQKELSGNVNIKEDIPKHTNNVLVEKFEKVNLDEKVHGNELVPVRPNIDEPIRKREEYYASVNLKLDKILEKSKAFAEKIDSFTGYEQDQEFYYIDENLQRNIDKLDRIDIKGSELLREKRKEVIKYIYRAVERLEDKAKENEKKAKEIEEKTKENEEKAKQIDEKAKLLLENVIHNEETLRYKQDIVNRCENKTKPQQIDENAKLLLENVIHNEETLQYKQDIVNRSEEYEKQLEEEAKEAEKIAKQNEEALAEMLQNLIA